MSKRAAQRWFILSAAALMLMFPLAGSLFKMAGIPGEKPFQFYCPRLEGFADPAPLPTVALSGWLDGQLQKSFDSWFNSNFGARNFLVRLNNELLYRAFARNYMYDGQLVASKRDVLYELNYVKDLFHPASADDIKKIDSLVADLKNLQTALAKRRVACVFVISPSKAALWPPSLNAWPQPQLADRRIYNELVERLDRMGVRYIDGHVLTQQVRSEGNQVFTRGGIHWTKLAAARTFNVALDEINRQHSSHFSQMTISHPIFERPDAIEADLAHLLNLLKPPYKYPAEHVTLARQENNGQTTGKFVFEGTSFTGQLVQIAETSRLFSDARYYFYYTHRLITSPGGKSYPVDPTKIDWEHDILNADAILIENNEALNLDHCEQFVKDALAHLSQTGLAQYQPQHSPALATKKAGTY